MRKSVFMLEGYHGRKAKNNPPPFYSLIYTGKRFFYLPIVVLDWNIDSYDFPLHLYWLNKEIRFYI